ncbi:MAG: Tol-Pal system beta propeller repeat protein TolB [Gammaproteobacteria bacterium]|nr:Tol-Pal system beta propeller repeat protein TolB [Gammaproteobacteria bacterium]
MNVFYKKFIPVFVFLVLLPFRAEAILNLELTQGLVSALPIAIVPFAGQTHEVTASDNVAGVVMADLQNSGRFKALPTSLMKQFPSSAQDLDLNQWKELGVDDVVVGTVKPVAGDKVQLEFSLFDVYKTEDAKKNPAILTQTFTVPAKDIRRAAHHISDLIYEQLIGQRGIFSTRIAYVMAKRRGEQRGYRLEVADADGYNPKAILISPEPIMSPAWSHNGRKLAYVSFENRRAEIYVADVMTGERHKVSASPGINGAPAWSPDDKKLAVVLSKGGLPKIYILDLTTQRFMPLTSGPGIDTEPHWSPDGRTLIFTSDRAGGPQIYRISVSGGQAQRLTFSGPYNARASFAADGKKIVMLHRADEGYTVAVQDLSSGAVQLLTRSGRDDSPSVAPNGAMVLYGNEYGNLGVVSVDGRVQLRLPARDGEVQSPAWSGFLS